MSPPKETRDFSTKGGPRKYVLEEAVIANFGLARAWTGARHDNLPHRDSARNSNPLAAMRGRVTIAEVEHLVEPGELDLDDVHTLGVIVRRMVALTPQQAVETRTPERGADHQTHRPVARPPWFKYCDLPFDNDPDRAGAQSAERTGGTT